MFSDELEEFVNESGYQYKPNGTTAAIPVIVELIQNGNKNTYVSTVEIEDNWSKYESNSLCINGADIKQKLGYEKFTSGYYSFNYVKQILRFNASGYQVIIYTR